MKKILFSTMLLVAIGISATIRTTISAAAMLDQPEKTKKTTTGDTVTILTNDGHLMPIPSSLAHRFQYIQSMIEDMPHSDEAIPLISEATTKATIEHLIRLITLLDDTTIKYQPQVFNLQTVYHELGPNADDHHNQEIQAITQFIALKKNVDSASSVESIDIYENKQKIIHYIRSHRLNNADVYNLLKTCAYLGIPELKYICAWYIIYYCKDIKPAEGLLSFYKQKSSFLATWNAIRAIVAKNRDDNDAEPNKYQFAGDFNAERNTFVFTLNLDEDEQTQQLIPPPPGNTSIEEIIAWCKAHQHELATIIDLELNALEIFTIPHIITFLPNLQRLILNNNNITEIPLHITGCTNLEYLHLNNNNIKKIPDFLACCIHLKELTLNNNHIVKFPSTLAPELKILDLSNNELTDISTSVLAQCSGLHSLNVSNNRIGSIPTDLAICSGLTSLWLNNNNISIIPSEIKQCTRLQELHLSGNNIQTIPDDIHEFPFNQLVLAENPLSSKSREQTLQRARTPEKSLFIFMPHDEKTSPKHQRNNLESTDIANRDDALCDDSRGGGAPA